MYLKFKIVLLVSFVLLFFFSSFTCIMAADDKIFTKIEAGDFAEVKRLIEENPERINMKDEYPHYTPLQFAAECGNKEIVELLLEYGANINVVDKYGETPLHKAANEGHKEICQLLLEKGADINAVTNDGMTPLHFAARWLYKEICQLLLEKGAHINAVDNDGWTPLHLAALNGHKEICQFLIEKGADINTVDNDGWTPLHKAAKNGHKEVCLLLLEKGVNINAVDNDGNTPLHVALGSCYVSDEVICFLIDRGANINAVNLSGKTPLDIAKDTEVKTLLMKHGAKEGYGLVFYLIKKGDIKKLKEFIEENPDIVHFRNIDDGNTPLHVAIAENSNDISLLLIEKGADINAINDDDNTPLISAIEEGNNYIIELLIKNGAEINNRSLCTACISQNNELVELLIKAGADVNGSGNGYVCPLQITFECGGNREIIKTLVNNGADVNVYPELAGPYWAQPNDILEIAVRWGDAELVELFIEKGLSPDSAIGDAIEIGDKKIVKLLLDKGAKSLHGAAFIGDIELAKSLLDEGFYIKEKIVMGSAHDCSEYTPLDCAKMGDNEDMIEFLISNGAK